MNHCEILDFKRLVIKLNVLLTASHIRKATTLSPLDLGGEREGRTWERVW